ncbi:predicted protein [Naegleria gruberi]|uniref:Predicted protein n=1 Tax=Naegleria gruberi TaxID=5762 RepID=D2VFN3_NAEGR|nr:uncharacterized protein NAEGRDRAFT_67685 [Naegleria gruberi]EFC44387.1 predicted protein [Naegleria gruberi]|eukprot:XP_002677131.1 predicted protein [Naegleria gruberi strain NEG-M]
MCGRSNLSLPPQRLRNAAAPHIGANLNTTLWVNQALYQPNFNLTTGAHLPLFFVDKNLNDQEKDIKKEVPDSCDKKKLIKLEAQVKIEEPTLATKIKDEFVEVKKEDNQSNIILKSEEIVKKEELETIEGLCIRTMNWGMYSQKAKAFSMNIRSESVAEKFGSILRRNRAILFVEGFYEWKSSTSGGKGQPYYIHPKQKGSLICLACLFDKKKGESGDDYQFSVLTVDADKTFSQIHHRMPAILTNIEDVRKWLGISPIKEENQLQSLLSLLKPYEFSQHLEMYKVSDFVNSTANNTSKCIKPLSEIQQGKGSLHSFFKPLSKKAPAEKRVKDETEDSSSHPSSKKIKSEPIEID